MTDYEKQTQNRELSEKTIEEIDPDYITGGARIVPPSETEGLMPTPHTQECNCGKFSPNKSGVCGAEICENCKHARKTQDNSKTTYCSLQPQIITIS